MSLTITITQTKTADGLHRIYTGTVKGGRRKGEVFGPVTVPDCGQGWGIFWNRLQKHFGCKCYTA